MKFSNYCFLIFFSLYLFDVSIDPVYGQISSPSLDAAFQYLNENMDRGNEKFWVYQDVNSPNNHFSERAKMWGGNGSGNVEMNECWTDNPHSGSTCIRCSFTTVNIPYWGGFFFQNGVWLNGKSSQEFNWGLYKDAGYDLTGATRLSFWARGEKGGERIKFFILGIGWRGSFINADNPDSDYERTTQYIPLNKEWTLHEINLEDADLSYVLDGFGWVGGSASTESGIQPVTFYVDDIWFDKTRPDEKRLLLSHETKAVSNLAFDNLEKKVAFTYDNALALLAFLTRGTQDDLRRARIIADTFVHISSHDPTNTDGGLRDTYSAGDPFLPPGWQPRGIPDEVKLPGYWDCAMQKWYQDGDTVNIHTGNVAWTIIALAAASHTLKDDTYLQTAIELGEWVEEKCRDNERAGGYLGGFQYNPPIDPPADPPQITSKATEHNLDLMVAFWWLYAMTYESKWEERYQHALNFVRAMWDEQEKKYWTGTTKNMIEFSIDMDVVPLDAQTWSVLAGLRGDGGIKALEYAKANLSVKTSAGLEGFDFNADKDGIWYEGTAQMSCAYKALGMDSEADRWSQVVENAQLDNGAIPAAFVDGSEKGLTTGFSWKYYYRGHLGATAWYIFSKLQKNPYWITDPPIAYPVFDITAIESWELY